MANYVPATANSLSGLNATALRKIAWDAKARVDQVRPSVISQVQTEFKILGMNEIIINKPGIMLDVTNVGKGQQGQSVRLALRTPLKAAPKMGTSELMLGNEDESALQWVECYYNEIKKAVKMFGWGYNYNDTEYLNYNAGYAQLLSLFHAEWDDTRCQQALLLTYAEELTKAPVSKAQQFNKNWIIPNLSESSYPAYDTDALTATDGSADADGYYSSRTYGGAGTFVQNIATALMSASGTSATSKAKLNVDNLSQIRHYVVHNHVVDPIMLDGKPTYILKIATPVFSWTLNPANTGSLAAHMLSVSDYKDPKRPELIGEVGRIFGDILLVHDTRSATLKVNGPALGAGYYTMQPGFLNPGNNDDRNNNPWSATSGSLNYVFDVCTILGANSLVRYRRDSLRTGLSETTEYGQNKGSGSYKGEGVQLCAYDLDAASQTATTQIQRGCAVVPISRNSVNTIS